MILPLDKKVKKNVSFLIDFSLFLKKKEKLLVYIISDIKVAKTQFLRL